MGPDTGRIATGLGLKEKTTIQVMVSGPNHRSFSIDFLFAL